jgi:site-specific recombinase
VDIDLSFDIATLPLWFKATTAAVACLVLAVCCIVAGYLDRRPRHKENK